MNPDGSTNNATTQALLAQTLQQLSSNFSQTSVSDDLHTHFVAAGGFGITQLVAIAAAIAASAVTAGAAAAAMGTTLTTMTLGESVVVGMASGVAGSLASQVVSGNGINFGANAQGGAIAAQNEVLNNTDDHPAEAAQNGEVLSAFGSLLGAVGDQLASAGRGALNTRRDHMKYLTLIRSIALWHQYQRQHETVTHPGETLTYIEVTKGGIALANRIAHEVLGRTLDELPPQTCRLEAFRATGDGWQTRINAALRVYLSEHLLRKASR